MRIRVGCEMTYQFAQATPMIVMLNVHASRVSDLEQPDYVLTTPSVPLEGYRDSFGNWCNMRFVLKSAFQLLRAARVTKLELIVRASAAEPRPQQAACAGSRPSASTPRREV